MLIYICNPCTLEGKTESSYIEEQTCYVCGQPGLHEMLSQTTIRAISEMGKFRVILNVLNTVGLNISKLTFNMSS